MIPDDRLMAIPRTLGAFPRRGHSRMPAGKRETCALRRAAVAGLWMRQGGGAGPRYSMVNSILFDVDPCGGVWVNG